MSDRRGRLAALLLAGLLATAPSASAGEAQDDIFALGVLEGVATGETLVYAHSRSGAAAGSETLPAIEDGRIEIALRPATGGGRAAHLALRDGERLRRLDPFPGDAGNPLLMVFMETSVNSMAAATGGNPVYIRNRMRDALRGESAGEDVVLDLAGGPVEGRRFVFRPFAGDPNAARMGAFAALEITFVLSDQVPGRFARLEAVTGAGADGAPALREAVSFMGIEEAER